jgi:hypothetical protein
MPGLDDLRLVRRHMAAPRGCPSSRWYAKGGKCDIAILDVFREKRGDLVMLQQGQLIRLKRTGREGEPLWA